MRQHAALYIRRVTCEIKRSEISMQVTRWQIQNRQAFSPILQMPDP